MKAVVPVPNQPLERMAGGGGRSRFRALLAGATAQFYRSARVMRSVSYSLLTLLLLTGCAAPSEVAGRFRGQRGDSMIIKEDGAMFWLPANGNSETGRFVGIVVTDKRNPAVIWLEVPSPTPFPYPRVTFSADRSRLTVSGAPSRKQPGRAFRQSMSAARERTPNLAAAVDAPSCVGSRSLRLGRRAAEQRRSPI